MSQLREQLEAMLDYVLLDLSGVLVPNDIETETIRKGHNWLRANLDKILSDKEMNQQGQLKEQLDAAIGVLEYECETYWLADDDDHAKKVVSGTEWLRANLEEIVAAAELDKREDVNHG